MRNRAFTLIELLVVVAVIAILAAIAVPNFLEAMTRAKVSRSMSDLRSLATALESYRVDSNRYPPDFQFGVDTFVDRLGRLTTPVSYITTLPSDPFVEKGRTDEYAATAGGLNANRENASQSGDFVYPLTYDYAFRLTPGGGIEDEATWSRIASNPGSTLWAMRGVGPDLWPAYLAADYPPYDPTNGTVSDGNIFWTGPGKGPDIPRSL